MTGNNSNVANTVAENSFVKPKSNGLDLTIRSLNEDYTRRLAKDLGNGKDAEVFGYIRVQSLGDTVMDKVQMRAAIAFGEDCQIHVVDAYDNLPESLKGSLNYRKGRTLTRYCVLWKQN